MFTSRTEKVYVSLEEKLLFKSGSDVVDRKEKALKSLAKCTEQHQRFHRGH